MFQNRQLGAALIIIGVLANNYVYLHDLILGKYKQYEGAIIFGQYENAIVLGWLAALLIIATLVVTAVGLMIIMRSHAPTATE
jgi:hypothetical protein